MIKFKECCKCGKQIMPKEKAVRWETYDVGKLKEQKDWHFKCFLEWRDESIRTKAMEVYNISMKGAMAQFGPMLKGIIQSS